MNVVHIVWICLIFCGCYQSAIIERQEDDRVKRRASLLTTDAADNVGYHDRNGQSDPRYLDVISKDHSKQLDNLEDVQDGTLEQTVKEKRCKTEGIVGVPSTLSLGRRDTTFALLKRSCENCWNSLMCKTKGKCESCKKICDKVEAVYEEMQVYEPIDQNSNQTEILGVPNKMSESVQEEGGLYYGENRYYTLGSFQPGPIYSLLAKLLNINNMEHVEQLLILAKTKSKKPIKTERPVVIDTAHVFTLNQGRPSKVDVEVHEVNGGDSNIDSFALELDKEIEKAMKMKKKKSGASHLAPSEIDNIIWKAIGRDPDKNARKLSELEWNDSPAHYSKDNTDGVGNQNFEKQKVKQNAPSAVGDHQFQRLTGQTLEEDALAQQEPSYLNSEVASPPLLSNRQSLLSEVSPVPERSHAGLSRSYKQDQQLVNKESSKAKQREQDYEDVEQSETSTKKHMQFPSGPSKNNPRGPKEPRLTSAAPRPVLTSKFPHGLKDPGGIRTTPIPIVQTTPSMKHPVVPQRSKVDDSDESLENEGFTIPPTTPETDTVSLQQFHNKKPNGNEESQQPTNSRNQKYSNEKTMEEPDWKHVVSKESSKAKQREQDYEEIEPSETSTKKHMQFPSGPSKNNPRGPKEPRLTSTAPRPVLTSKFPHGPKDPGGIRTTPIPIVQTTPFMKHPVVPQRSMVDDSDESLENEGVSIPPTTPETVIVSLQQFHNKIPNENKESQQPTNSRNQKYSNEKTMEGPDWKHVVSKESSKAKQREQDYEEIEPSETSTKKHMQFPSGPSKNNPRGPKEPRLTSAAPRPVLTSKFPHGPKDPGGIRTTPIPIVQTTPSMKHPVVPQRSKVDDSDESLENEGFTIPPTTPETDTVSLQQFHNKKPNGNEESQQPTNSRNQKYSNEKTMEEPDWKHVVSKESSKAKQREQDYEEIEPSETSTKKHMQFPSGPSKNNPRGPKEPRLTSTAPHPVLTSKFPHGPKDPGGIRTTPIPIVQTTPFMKHPVVPQRSKVDDSDESLENEGFTIPPTTPETDTVSLQQFHNKKPNGNGESQQPTNPISQKYSNEKIMKVADLEDRHINRGQDLPQRNADNDYKYKQLKQWIMKHSHKLPPDLRDSLPEFQEKSGNKLAQNVNDIISSASKINEEISNIVETDTSNPNLVQMVKKNDEKLRAISDDNDKYIIGFPNMNKFKTRIAPETQRKIDQIFASERPLASVRKMKDLYGFHPRMKSEYRDGKWVYEKTKPNRPPYSTNHRTPTVLNDQQMLEDNASNEKSREAAVTYVDPKLLNMDSVMKGLKNTPKMYYDKTNKVLGVKQYETMDEQNTNPIISTQHQSEQENMQGDEASRIVHEGQESAISQKKLTQNIPNNNRDHKEDESKENSSEKKNKSNETVACSKEEEEEMLEVLHLHPISYGEYRSSEREGSTDRQSNNLNHSWGKVKLHSATEVPTAKNDNIQSQHPLKHIADETERIINSLSNKHNIADTDDTTNNQARNEEDDDIKNKKQFIPFQPAYFSPQHRNFVPMRTVPEMTQESINRNFMKQPMIFEPNTNNMEQELIGIPAMSSRMQKPYLEGLTRMGKFVPRDGERRLSLHSRDVSEQEKSKDIYFIGDGIKLPLNMEEHNDGSVHLTVDIKSLCNCKHCRGKQLENGTIVLEATPLTEKERQEHEAETKANKLPEKKDEKNTTTYDEYVYEDYMLYVDTEESLEDEKINPMAHNDKVNVSKRSAGSTNSLQDNEIESSISSTSEEDPVIPLKHLSRQEILDRLAEIKEKEKNLKDDHKKLETNNSNDQHDDSDGDKINPKFQLFTNVLDFVKKIALDIQPKK